MPNIERATDEVRNAGKVLVVGTSLSVYPAAGLLDVAPAGAEKVIISPDLQENPQDYQWFRETAVARVPQLVANWLESEFGKGLNNK